MKAVKEGKGGNNKQQKSAQSLDSPGALFPRLHVRETKNVGPRAPPRNKMALYEQLTISSHRFQQQQQQLKGASTSSSVRPTAGATFMAPQTYPAGYYVPCYLAPPVPFHSMPMMGQQAVPGQNNGDMEELQRVPGLPAGDNTGQLQRLASCQSNSGTLKVTSSKKSREGQEDFTVPTYKTAMTTKSLRAGKTSATDSMSTAIEESRQARELASEGQSARTFDTPGYKNTSADSRSTVFDRRQGESKQSQVQQSPSNSENNGDLDNPSDEEQTGQSRPGNSEMSEGSEASMLVDGTKVSSKDVMNLAGERHFWEVRRTIQRQQRLFHNQLFELHRVTKVQHLMSAPAISSIEDDTDVLPAKMLPAPLPAAPTVAPTRQEADKTVPEPKQPSPPSQPLTASVSAPVAPPKPVDNYSAPALPPPAPPNSAPQEYASYPAPYFLPGTNGGYPAPYAGFSGNQWFTQVPVSYPYHQPFAAPVGVYNSPYGPVFTGHSPMPFVPYPVPGYERDPRFNMAASNAAAAAAASFGNSTQWMNYPRPFTNLAPNASSSFGSTHQQTFPAAPAPAPALTRKEQSINNSKNNRSYSKLTRTDTGSSTGFNLIQRAEAGGASASKPMEVEEQSQQQQQPQPSMDPALYSYFFSPVESEQRQQQLQQQQKVTKVAPKASLVTPESAAGILQSLRQQER